MLRRLFLTPLLILAWHAGATAASLVEQYAESAAKEANAAYQRTPPDDGVTRSARAYAAGGTLVHEYVLAIRSNVTERELQTWRASVRSEVIPQSCAFLKNDQFFNSRGFQVRYRYINRSGQVLDEFTVNKPACQGL